MKKIAAALLALAMLIALVSCSSGGNGTSPKKETETADLPDTGSGTAVSETETSSEDTGDQDPDQNTVSVRKLGIICLKKTEFGETELAENCRYYGFDRAGIESYQAEYIGYSEGPQEQSLVTESLIEEGYETIIFDVCSFLDYEYLPQLRANAEQMEKEHDNVRIYVPEDGDAASEG